MWHSPLIRVAVGLALAGCTSTLAENALPEHVWIEAETLAPLKGSNFSFTPVERQEKGAWAVSGPGVADAWTQGGESEWMSIAARADEAVGIVAGREIEVPIDATYALWVRYSDYRDAEEVFGVRVTQEGRGTEHLFGKIGRAHV